MDKNQQILDMTLDITHEAFFPLEMSGAIATGLYDKGWRKQSKRSVEEIDKKNDMYSSVNYLMGLRLIETTAFTKQVQKRRHRKRRINKKWLKRYGYKTILDDGKIVYVGDCIYATPNTIKKLISAYKGE